MELTGRYWEAVALSSVLLIAGVIFSNHSLLIGGSILAAWLLATQAAFVYATGHLHSTAEVSQSLSKAVAPTDESVSATLNMEGRSTGLDITVQARPSPGLITDGAQQTEVNEAIQFAVKSTIPGVHKLRQPSIEVSDPVGLFRQRFHSGPSQDLTIEARQPSNVHVGKGGKAVPLAFGEHSPEHSLDRLSLGIDPAELREYVKGDAISQIDWKATARLAEPYVRSFEPDSSQRTIVVFDRRAGGNEDANRAETLDYLKAIGLVQVTIAQNLNDPIGVFTVSEESVERVVSPTDTPRGYNLVRQRLRTIAETTGTTAERRLLPLRRRVTTLDRSTQFGKTLSIVGGIDNSTETPDHIDPLVAAMRMVRAEATDTARVVLCTDGADQAAIRDAVMTARRDNHLVSVFIAPQFLFGPGSLADVPAVVQQYEAFDKFRRNLSDIGGVDAYEIAPTDRIEAVLAEYRRKPPSSTPE